MDVEFLFVEEELEEKTLQARIQVPVDKTNVIAGHIVAEIGELDRMAVTRAAAFPAELPGVAPAHGEAPLLQTAQKIGLQQGLRCFAHV